jgi:hypothetical protein
VETFLRSRTKKIAFWFKRDLYFVIGLIRLSYLSFRFHSYCAL